MFSLYNNVNLLSPQNNSHSHFFSKQLATNSTLLSENVQIEPNVSIFCVASIIFQHCLNPLGHGVHQSFTGCHWSPLPLLHDDFTELVDVRDLALLHPLFEDAPQMTFTLSSFTKTVVILEVWLVPVVMLEYCPTAQSPKGGDHALLQYVTVHFGIHGYPQLTVATQLPLVQPQTMTHPPPYLTVGKTHLSLYSSFGCRHTHLTPSEPNKFALVSSDHSTWFH